MARFEDLYREHFTFAWRVARGLGVPESELEDIVHEVFMVVDRKLGALDPSRSVRAWIGGITRNVVMHHRRSLARRSRKLAVAPGPPGFARPDQATERSEALRLVDAFLRDLPGEQRDVFVLMEVEGLTAPEAMTVLGVPQAKLYSRLRAARARFERFAADLAKEDPHAARA